MDPGSLLMLFVTGGVAVAGVSVAVWYQGHQARKRDEAWRAVAEARGGRFTEGDIGLFKFESPTLDVMVEHAVVRLDLLAVQSGKNRHLYTRARAVYALGAGPTFDVKREGVFQMVGKALGGQDVELGGDAAFDELFVVKTDDPEATREAWTGGAKTLMRTHFDGAHVIADGSAVALTYFGVITDAAELYALLDLVGAVASRGARVLARYRSIEGARWTPAAGPFAQPVPPRLTVETSRGEVTVMVLVTGGPARVRLRIAHSRADLAPFSVDLTEAPEAGLPRGLVTERAKMIARRVTGVTVAGDATTLQITWRRPPTAEVLEAGVQLIGELAGGAPSAGAFR